MFHKSKRLSLFLPFDAVSPWKPFIGGHITCLQWICSSSPCAGDSLLLIWIYHSLYHHVSLYVISIFLFLNWGKIRDVFSFSVGDLTFISYQGMWRLLLFCMALSSSYVICIDFLIYFFSFIWILKGVDKLASFVSHDFHGNFTLLGTSLTFTLIIVNCGCNVQSVEMKFRTRNILREIFFWIRWV